MPDRPRLSARAWAFGSDTRVSAVSAAARKIDRTNSTATTPMTARSRRLTNGLPVVRLEQLLLLGLHPRRLLGVGVVVAEDVEDPVHDQEGELVRKRPVVARASVLGRVAGGDGRADHDVAEQQRRFGGVGAVARVDGSGGARVGEATRLDQLVLEREGQDVGRARRAHEPVVELGDGLLVDEEHGQLGIAADALVSEHRLGELLPPRGVDLLGALLVADEHLEVALLRQSAATAREGERGPGGDSRTLVVGIGHGYRRRRSEPVVVGLSTPSRRRRRCPARCGAARRRAK